ncbi:MAG: GNAT family N-acetyltransferase [Verrucomicrobiales bacterium]|jgi:GNAT superfamily N-acetyltransferase|nr:GNAT family N-acetyltransferase [Verrucomicrobiales bacterium]
MKKTFQDFTISDDKKLLQFDKIIAMLRNTYWARHRPEEVIRRASKNSLCFGIYTAHGEQVGFARAVTDRATVYWLCDVVIAETRRKQGLGKALVQFITGHPKLQSMTGILRTEDAHGLYAQYGFLRNTTFMRRAVAPANDPFHH